ncbi:hypothetical protein BDV41DRAFT_523607 [Aspergillus transmontanensis]|uniref:Uncharacterized protein n=1 Tax=Aspergillus transmontanensis TaxID=1034304 RepID=A0A5N6WBW0_9EURO|nr:hypothetical protein BDV41DRAFT_523607 [Aspergillus transmontanensis]
MIFFVSLVGEHRLFSRVFTVMCLLYMDGMVCDIVFGLFRLVHLEAIRRSCLLEDCLPF